MKKNTIKTILIAFNLLVVLSYFSLQIYHKEQLLDKGTRIRLQLAPVDPRSLMQGDYMALRYKVTDHCYTDSANYVVVSVPKGDFIRTQRNMQNIASNEAAIKVLHNGYTCHLSSESYFFEEGSGELYQDAKYALVVVDTDGSIFITNLCDSIGNIIEPKDDKNHP